MKPQAAEIFYHINEPSKQKIVIDADNEKGKILFPKLVKKNMTVGDARDEKLAPTFTKDFIEFFNYPTRINDFDGSEFKEVYNQELEFFLKENLNAVEVVVFDHTIREDSVSARPPARHAHVDYSKKSAEEQIAKYIKKEEQEEWLAGSYAIINSWRPIVNKVESAPLGFILPSSIERKDLIEIDLVYPGRMGEVMGALHNENHQWVYLSEMEPSEIVFFTMYANNGQNPVIHSAFDLEETKTGAVRKSIESRILVRF